MQPTLKASAAAAAVVKRKWATWNAPPELRSRVNLLYPADIRSHELVSNSEQIFLLSTSKHTESLTHLFIFAADSIFFLPFTNKHKNLPKLILRRSGPLVTVVNDTGAIHVSRNDTYSSAGCLLIVIGRRRRVGGYVWPLSLFGSEEFCICVYGDDNSNKKLANYQWSLSAQVKPAEIASDSKEQYKNNDDSPTHLWLWAIP